MMTSVENGEGTPKQGIVVQFFNAFEHYELARLYETRLLGCAER